MKYILVFNGYPESGKTTFQKAIAQKYHSVIYSSIKPVIEFTDDIFRGCDSEYLWHKYLREKEKKSNSYRHLLSDIKNTLYNFDDEYLDNIILNEVVNFLNNDDQYFFMIDIREPERIKDFIKKLEGLKYKEHVNNKKFKVKTVFIKRDNEKYYGNNSDDNVENYQYDILVNNNKSLDVLKNECLKAFIEVLYSDWEM